MMGSHDLDQVRFSALAGWKARQLNSSSRKSDAAGWSTYHVLTATWTSWRESET